MSPTSRWSRIRDHATLVGDSMLFILPVGLVFIGVATNLTAGLGLGGAGFAVGCALAPAGGLFVSWLLRSGKLDESQKLALFPATLATVALAAGAYAAVVTRGLDDTRAFRIAVMSLLVIEGIALIGLLVDAFADLTRERRNSPVDYARIAGAAIVIILLAVFRSNPDLGEILVVVAPLALAGAVTAVLADGLSTLRDRQHEDAWGHPA